MTSVQMSLYLLVQAARFLIGALRFVVPHFETNDLAVDLVPNQTYTKEQLNDFNNYEIICCVEDLEAGEEYDAICPVREFAWLCFGFFPRQIGDIRPFVNPNNGGV